MLIRFATEESPPSAVATANVVLGLASAAEALRLGATGRAREALWSAGRQLSVVQRLLYGVPFSFRGDRYLWPFFLYAPFRRSPRTALLVASITSGPLPEGTAVLARLGIGSLEAQFERLFKRVGGALRRVVEAATRSAQALTTDRDTSQIGAELSNTAFDAATEAWQGDHRNRDACAVLVASSTALLVDGLQQVRVRWVEIQD
jgi:hypothetical protein